ncbi:hypothetical protein ACFL56_03860, partial [Candidatus Margulisiibacteriota bacterium]
MSIIGKIPGKIPDNFFMRSGSQKYIDMSEEGYDNIVNYLWSSPERLTVNTLDTLLFLKAIEDFENHQDSLKDYLDSFENNENVFLVRKMIYYYSFFRVSVSGNSYCRYEDDSGIDKANNLITTLRDWGIDTENYERCLDAVVEIFNDHIEEQNIFSQFRTNVRDAVSQDINRQATQAPTIEELIPEGLELCDTTQTIDPHIIQSTEEFGENIAVVRQNNVAIVMNPEEIDQLISFNFGECVALTFWDPVTHQGGLAHI